MSRFLTQDELIELTGRHTRPAQIKRLKAKGIRFIDDPPDASLTVLWSWVHKAAGEKVQDETEDKPDFSWMRKTA